MSRPASNYMGRPVGVNWSAFLWGAGWGFFNRSSILSVAMIAMLTLVREEYYFESPIVGGYALMAMVSVGMALIGNRMLARRIQKAVLDEADSLARRRSTQASQYKQLLLGITFRILLYFSFLQGFTVGVITPAELLAFALIDITAILITVLLSFLQSEKSVLYRGNDISLASVYFAPVRLSRERPKVDDASKWNPFDDEA